MPVRKTLHARSGERLNAAIKDRKIKKSELAQMIGITKQTLGDILAGRAPGLIHLPALAKILTIYPEWIQTGIGPRDHPMHSSIEELIFRCNAREARDLGELLHKFYVQFYRMNVIDPKNTERKFGFLYHSLLESIGWRPHSLFHVRADFNDIEKALRIYEFEFIDPSSARMGYDKVRALYEGRHKAHASLHATTKEQSKGIPIDEFCTIRKSLISIIHQRELFGTPSDDIKIALGELWLRQGDTTIEIKNDIVEIAQDERHGFILYKQKYAPIVL